MNILTQYAVRGHDVNEAVEHVWAGVLKGIDRVGGVVPGGSTPAPLAVFLLGREGAHTSPPHNKLRHPLPSVLLVMVVVP